MLSRPNRLPAPDIRSVLRRGRRVSDTFCQITFSKTPLPLSRFAFIVSTQIDKRATARNRIKRLLRERVREQLSLIGPGVDIVISARSKQLVTDEAKLAPSITGLLAEAGLL